MKKNLITAVLMTIATTILLGIVYPLVITGIARVLFPDKANGQLIQRYGNIVGSRIIGQNNVGVLAQMRINAPSESQSRAL